jgi:RNA polymerase sigma factor (sigma-70 family)
MIEMKERRHDFELLQRFTRYGEQAAFSDVVRRHLNLVFATALRKVADAGGAQEISQNVFSALARKAWRFAPDDSLPAWLHKTALLESKSWLRGELRRRRREQTAAELGTAMNAPDDQPAFNSLVPLLDDALLSLRENDRTALLLRYYESQSLREVGQALGVSEDTAQKRVGSALEKLAEFFTRRGYKTATVAAAAAALQHTGASASTSVASAVLAAAVQAAPPALAGLGALFARIASLSRVQTAAVCITVAALPVAWQLNENHTVGEQAKSIQTQLLTTQNEAVTAQAEIERLRALHGTLEQSVAQANEAAARAAASAQAFAVWKKKIHGLITAADYQWEDDSAFVRIPKSVLPELNELAKSRPFSPPGVVNPYARELMSLTPAERQTMEDILQPVAKLQYGEKAEVYERDNPPRGGRLASRLFFNEPAGQVGAEAEQRLAQMLTEIRGTLGEERWPALPAVFRSINCDVWNRALIPAPSASIETWVESDEKGIPKANWTYTGEMTRTATKPPSRSKDGNVYSMNVVGYKNGTAALSAFLPDGDPRKTKGGANFDGGPAPEPVRRRVLTWLQEQAVARLGKKENP